MADGAGARVWRRSTTVWRARRAAAVRVTAGRIGVHAAPALAAWTTLRRADPAAAALIAAGRMGRPVVPALAAWTTVRRADPAAAALIAAGRIGAPAASAPQRGRRCGARIGPGGDDGGLHPAWHWLRGPGSAVRRLRAR